jgi:hypothetical protein
MKSSSATVANDLSMKSSMKEILRPKKHNENKGDDGVLEFRKNTERGNNLVKEAEPRR